MQRARKGGEIGMNGERYEGGQFLPNTTLPKQATRKTRRGSGKQEVAPYTWEVAPTETAKSIYCIVGMGATATVCHGEMIYLDDNTAALKHYGETACGWHKSDLVVKWNAGERWIEPKEENIRC